MEGQIQLDCCTWQCTASNERCKQLFNVGGPIRTFAFDAERKMIAVSANEFLHLLSVENDCKRFEHYSFKHDGITFVAFTQKTKKKTCLNPKGEYRYL